MITDVTVIDLNRSMVPKGKLAGKVKRVICAREKNVLFFPQHVSDLQLNSPLLSRINAAAITLHDFFKSKFWGDEASFSVRLLMDEKMTQRDLPLIH